MKQSHSNPLLKELGRATTAGAHPDADLLVAFAEGTLLQGEKREVLAHLAACADCREILGAATASAPVPASGPAAIQLRPQRRPVRIWLPWAGTATALLVVSVSILLYQQHAAHQNTPIVAKDTVTEAPLLASPQTPSAPPPARQKTQMRRDEFDRTAKKAESTAGSPSPPAVATPASQQSIDLEAREKPSQQVQNNDSLQNELAAQSDGRNRQQAVGGAGNGIQQSYSAQQDLKSNQPARQTSINQAPATPQSSSAAFAQVEPQGAMAKAAVTGLERPHWRINSAGQPERSFGNGTWQPVLPQETSRMRVISVFVDQVWTGGDHTRLYRSVDNGAVWTQVALPEKNGADHAIVHIRFEAPGTITVEATDGVTWTSSDNGATWN